MLNTNLTIKDILEAQSIMAILPGRPTMKVADPTVIELIEQQHRENRIIRQLNELNEKHK